MPSEYKKWARSGQEGYICLCGHRCSVLVSKLALSATQWPPFATIRMFYREAKASGIIVNPVELFVICTSTVIGYLLSLLLRILTIAIILIPFFGLIRHARREGGSVVSDLADIMGRLYLRCVRKVPLNSTMQRLLQKVRVLGDVS
jgi:hypothetical protein